MKVKNIMFFGFAAAILSIANANAAPTHPTATTYNGLSVPATATDSDKKIVTSKAYVDKHTNALKADIEAINIPTAVSDLTNDTGFITSTDIPDALSDFTDDIDAANVVNTVKVNGSALTPDANKAVDITVPTNNNQLTNGAGYITSADLPDALSDLTDDIDAANIIDTVKVGGTALTVTNKEVDISTASTAASITGATGAGLNALTTAGAVKDALGGNSIPTQPAACSTAGNTCALISDEGTLKWVVMANDTNNGSVPANN